MMNQKLHDSGERREFSSGAVRDRGDLKPRPDLISPHAQMREGMIYTLGSQKYALRNWEQGMPISVCLASAQRHIEQYKLGETDEDHLAQARWNLGAMIHFEEEIKAGRMSSEFADMPHYAKREATVPDSFYVTGYDPASPEGDESVVSEPIIEEGKHTSYCMCLKCLSEAVEKDMARQDKDALEKAKQLITDNEVKFPPFSVEEAMQEGLEVLRKGEPLVTREVELPTFYVCGPMTGMKDFNFPLFDQVTELARSQGLSVISPAELDREHGIDPSVDPDSVERARRADPNLIQTIVQRDTQVIVGLERDKGDGLILLPGWANSTGGRAEIALAVWMDLAFKLVTNTWHEQKCEITIKGVDLEWVKEHLFYQRDDDTCRQEAE
ncbi:DUF4406 domain-containing protein [Candidatus Pacearchaeota archaeon]|nr:DUF4406 domain-containing protein [Candidatus Pacearchaeota archaeon]